MQTKAPTESHVPMCLGSESPDGGKTGSQFQELTGERREKMTDRTQAQDLDILI